MSISPVTKKTSYIGALSPEYAFLGLLALQPAHGYELHQHLEADLGQIWHISLSQTYNILNRLETKDYIQGEMEEQEKLPSRRIFSLTDTGQTRFEDWLHTPSGSSVRAIRVEFTTRLYFAYRKDLELADQLIETQIVETRAGLSRLMSTLENVPKVQVFNRLALEMRVQQLESIIDWLHKCGRILKDQQSTEANLK